MDKNYQSYWNKICTIHYFTKHYQLIAEELKIEAMFIQPLKEHRDAYDHIIRIFSIDLNENKPKNIDEYRKSNFQDAISHEYRAFCDTADWLTVICRKAIRKILKNQPSEEFIKEKYPKYLEIDSKLIEFSIMVAKEREGKDIGGNVIDKVISYSKVLDEIINYYKEIVAVFPCVAIENTNITDDESN